MSGQITIYIDGRSYAGKGSGFAVILMSMNNKWLRSLAYGKYTVNQADLLALKFSILSLKNNDDEISVFTKNDYIINTFNKVDGKYAQVPSSNIDLINEIKQLIESKNVKILKSDKSELSDLCKNMVIDAIKNGKLVDIKK